MKENFALYNPKTEKTALYLLQCVADLLWLQEQKKIKIPDSKRDFEIVIVEQLRQEG